MVLPHWVSKPRSTTLQASKDFILIRLNELKTKTLPFTFASSIIRNSKTQSLLTYVFLCIAVREKNVLYMILNLKTRVTKGRKLCNPLLTYDIVYYRISIYSSKYGSCIWYCHMSSQPLRRQIGLLFTYTILKFYQVLQF